MDEGRDWTERAANRIRHARCTRATRYLRLLFSVTCTVGSVVSRKEQRIELKLQLLLRTQPAAGFVHIPSLPSRPPPCGLGLPSSILSGSHFFPPLSHLAFFLSLFPLSLLSFHPFLQPSSLLHYSYSLLGPRWLIVYATRFSHLSSPQTNTRLPHLLFISSHCETGLVSNAPRT